MGRWGNRESFLHIAADFPDSYYFLDEQMMSWALVQILGNAILHGEGRPVDVALRGDQLRITDHGRAIPNESLEPLFGVFQRGPGTSSCVLKKEPRTPRCKRAARSVRTGREHGERGRLGPQAL